MALIKLIFKWIGIEKLILKLVQYGFSNLIERDPSLLHKLEESHTQQHLKQLRSDISHIGTNVFINGILRVSHHKGLLLGNNIHIDNNCYFFSRAGITIKDNVHISRNVTIYTSFHNYEGSYLPFDASYKDKPVVIEENVWIGTNVNILPGVHIGKGAIIGIGSTISSDVGMGEIVGPQKVKILNHRNLEHYNALDEKKLYGGVDGKKLSTDVLDSYYRSLDDSTCTPFFVVSTGRSGSTTMATVLNKHPSIQCLHEPKVQLIRISTDLLHNKITDAEAEAELRDLYLNSPNTNLPFYGESDQKLSNLITILARIMPNAKFIWIIRNAKDTVNSTWSRGWFSDEELGLNGKSPDNYKLYRGIFSDYRPQGNLAKNIDNATWLKYTAFERNCWYWTFWNQTIKEQLSRIPKERWLKVNLGNLSNDIPHTQEFLGVKNYELKNIITNKSETKYKLKTDNVWTNDMRKSFLNLCNKDFMNDD